MAFSPSHAAVRNAVALMVVGVLLLAGCGSDDTVDRQEAAPAAPATTPTDSTAPTAPAGAPSADAVPSPIPEVAAPEETAGDSNGGTEATPEAPAEELVITIVDFAYELPDTVPPGSTITVVNKDAAAHTVTSTGVFDVNLTGGETGTFTAPEEPGEYKIICLFHGNMTATLVVG